MDASASLQSIGDVAIGQSQNASAALAAKKLSGPALDKAAGDFESMFMSQMMQPMFDGIGSDPLFGGGHGEEAMKSFLVQEYGKIASKTGRLGITAAVKNEMIMAQARASGGAAAAASISAGG